MRRKLFEISLWRGLIKFVSGDFRIQNSSKYGGEFNAKIAKPQSAISFSHAPSGAGGLSDNIFDKRLGQPAKCACLYVGKTIQQNGVVNA